MKQIHTDQAPKAVGPYSQAIQVGDFIFLSGQGGIDPATGKVVEGVEAQTRQALENMSHVLEEAGSSMEAVVKTTCFLQEMDDFAAFNAVYAEYFPQKPARSCIAAKELPLKFLCEIEAIAYVGKE